MQMQSQNKTTLWLNKSKSLAEETNERNLLHLNLPE